jgi:hypothetical protein
MKTEKKKSFLDLSKLDSAELEEIERQRWIEYREAEREVKKLPELKRVQELNDSWSLIFNLIQARKQLKSAEENLDRLKKESDQKQNNKEE